MKDYYKILGVSDNATQDEIKKAFRKLAMENHPDRNPDNKEAESRFKDANEANEVLSDENKRKEYNYKRKNPGHNMHDPFSGGFHDPFSDVVNNFIHRQQRGQNESKVVVPLTLSEVLNGGIKQIIFNKQNICTDCKGTGKDKTEQCPVCNGMGMISNRQQQGNTIFETIGPCYHCHGAGFVSSGGNCSKCGGVGYHIEHQTFQVDVPIGIPYGVAIRVPNKGNNNGDLNVIFVPDKSDKYERAGDDIASFIELSYPEIILGAEKVIDTIDSGVKVKINKLSKPEDKIRLRGLGLPNYHHHGRGDLFLILKLKEISQITEIEEQLLQSLAKETNFKTL